MDCSTHNLCFEQKYEKYQIFLSEHFPFLVVKFSIYLNRRVFVTLVLLNPDTGMSCLANSVNPDQLASDLIWICTVCHLVCEFISTIGSCYLTG